MINLGVNIDHVGTLREARKVNYPDPVHAAVLCELSGANSVIAHLREDKRHIKERDIRLIRELIHIKFNLEMESSQEILETALEVHPDQITLVPEKRGEVTTEGGLDVISMKNKLRDFTKRIKNEGIEVSLFIDPIPSFIETSKEIDATSVEFHTGRYSDAKGKETEKELKKLKDACILSNKIGLKVHAGHGLNYWNVRPIAKLPYMEELNIGHSIISYAVFVGIEKAIREMLQLINSP